MSDLKKPSTDLIDCHDMIDCHDSYERRDTINLSGNDIPEVPNGKICSNIVHDIVQNKLHIELFPNEIDIAHHLGSKKQTSGLDKRSIIVNLCRRDTKRQLTAAARSEDSRSPAYKKPG